MRTHLELFRGVRTWNNCAKISTIELVLISNVRFDWSSQHMVEQRYICQSMSQWYVVLHLNNKNLMFFRPYVKTYWRSDFNMIETRATHVKLNGVIQMGKALHSERWLQSYQIQHKLQTKRIFCMCMHQNIATILHVCVHVWKRHNQHWKPIVENIVKINVNRREWLRRQWKSLSIFKKCEDPGPDPAQDSGAVESPGAMQIPVGFILAVKLDPWSHEEETCGSN